MVARYDNFMSKVELRKNRKKLFKALLSTVPGKISTMNEKISRNIIY